MTDLHIVGLYALALVVNRSAGSLLALFVWSAVAYTAYNVDFSYTYDDTYFFAVLSLVYLICAIKMRKWQESAWMGCIFVSLYYLYFSFDSWVNWDVETWAYTNHESIVFTTHFFVVLLLIKVRLTMVFARINLLWRNRCSGKGN